jgi:hypothetical protein
MDATLKVASPTKILELLKGENLDRWARTDESDPRPQGKQRAFSLLSQLGEEKWWLTRVVCWNPLDGMDQDRLRLRVDAV